MPPRTHLCSEFWKPLTLCSSVLTQSPPCRSFRSDKDSLPSLHALLLVWTSSLHQRLLQVVYHLFPCQICAPQTLQTSQATSDSQEALKFHFDGFHREAPSVFQLYLDSSIVDRLSKQSLFIPTHDTIMSQQLAQLFVRHIFSKHGVPSHIPSYCGMEFISHFFQSLGTALDMKLHLTSRYHPEGDGQTERTNQTLEQYLRVYCNYQQDNWSELLQLAEFAYNNTPSATTSITPFFSNKCYHPNLTVHPECDLASAHTHEFITDLNELHHEL